VSNSEVSIDEVAIDEVARNPNAFELILSGHTTGHVNGRYSYDG
jgi:hypothetical protein